MKLREKTRQLENSVYNGMGNLTNEGPDGL